MVLVEGPTEEMLINAIMQSDDNHLNTIEVIAIGQKGFKTFMDVWLTVNSGNANRKLGIVRDFDNQSNARDEHDEYDASNNNIIVRTTVGYTLEDDLAAEGNNTAVLAEVFDLPDGSSADDVSNYMKNGKAEEMLKLCDAIIEEVHAVALPAHIREVIDFCHD